MVCTDIRILQYSSDYLAVSGVHSERMRRQSSSPEYRRPSSCHFTQSDHPPVVFVNFFPLLNYMSAVLYLFYHTVMVYTN